MANWSPFMRTVTIGTTATSLQTLLNGIDANLPNRCNLLNVQYSPGATAASHLYVGNSVVTAVLCGFDLIVGASTGFIGNDVDLILLSDVYLLCTVATQLANITVFGAGM